MTSSPRSGAPLLEVRNLDVRFGARGRSGEVAAVRGVSFTIAPGKILGLIGESGSGKTTVARTVMGLVRSATGSVRFEGREILGLSERELRKVRRRLHLVFQDPYDSLHPGMRVREIVEEAMKIHGIGERASRRAAVSNALEDVGLTPSSRFTERYPHQLSGGQRQRVAIARAMVLDPALVLADEPTSMLDLSLRSEILEILKRHRDTRGTGYLFITHDLALAGYLCDRIAVMFRGKLVELGPTETVITNPLHPYTKMLLQAVEELAPPEPHKPEDYQASDHGIKMEESYATIIPELREVAPDHYVAHPPNRQATPDQAVPDKED
ncbi:MAG: ABC transporter ATP-binding protein [Actinomycetota bacterium]|nr:ABC transporter ATP-binding protein [Actinomycetota bacterium]